MKEIKFVGHKINLLVTDWHILFRITILCWQFNTWSGICTQKTTALFKGTTNIQKLNLIAQDQMKSMFYKIKCPAASDQILNCQPKIVILNNICHSVTSKLLRLDFHKYRTENVFGSLISGDTEQKMSLEI
jgi:ribosomal protein S27E